MKQRLKKMFKKIGVLFAVALILGAGSVIALNSKESKSNMNQLTTDLTDEEIESLLFMREEEKLARDVYLTLGNLYNSLKIFENIANSEQRHMDSIKNLLDKYNLEDPAEGKDIGEFTNQDLQNLYTALVSEGEQSLIDALTVGGKIEEIDIIDLKNYIEITDKPDIKNVYSNLLEGSKNHLRAYVKELDKQGVTYEPFYLSQEEFDDIINEKNLQNNKQQNKESQNRQSQSKQMKIRTKIRNMIKENINQFFRERKIIRNMFGGE
jgi:hypothetical protein